MRTAKKRLGGFDYRLAQSVERTTPEWGEELRTVLKNGGRRRHEEGETFAHGPDGRIVFEVYGYLPGPAS